MTSAEINKEIAKTEAAMESAAIAYNLKLWLELRKNISKLYAARDSHQSNTVSTYHLAYGLISNN